MLELMNVKKTFNSGRPNEYTAIDGVNLSLFENRVIVLKGPSGSGKTTLLSMMGCMARPTSGRIQLCLREGVKGFSGNGGSPEVEVTSLPERFLTEIRRKTFGFIFQQFNLIRGISALDNVMLPAYPLGEPVKEVRERACEIMGKLSVYHRASARVEWLSGGEAQRVAIARALINEPPVIIADEPTSHLDTRLSSEFMDFLVRFKDQGKTTILSSHDPLVCDSSVVDDVVSVRDGRIERNVG